MIMQTGTLVVLVKIFKETEPKSDVLTLRPFSNYECHSLNQ